MLIDALPVLAVGGFLWRQIASLDRRFGSVERGLSDVAQRLASRRPYRRLAGSPASAGAGRMTHAGLDTSACIATPSQ